MAGNLAFIFMSLIYIGLTFMAAVLAWSRGFNAGRSEGYARGRNINRTRSEAFKDVSKKTAYWCGDCGRHTLTDHMELSPHTMDTVK